MLQVLTGHFYSIKNTQAEMKVILIEIKKNPQRTNSEGKDAGVQINDLEYKEKINSQV